MDEGRNKRDIGQAEKQIMDMTALNIMKGTVKAPDVETRKLGILALKKQFMT